MTGKELQRIPPQPPPPEENPLELIGAMARLAGMAWLRTAEWGLDASLRVARAAVDPRAAIKMARDTGDELRAYAREFLGVADLEERVRHLIRTPAAAVPDEESRIDVLRTRGEALLRASADVNRDEETHPAYARILDELAPDEARILRFLALEGSQPAVDVRVSQLIGVGSQLVAEGISMIGLEAGVRYQERVASYLNNLNRLGLIWFSKEPIREPARYQVLEAQPDVLGALKSSRRSKSVQRSILLTPFGRDFCQVCLPLGDSAPDEPLGDAALDQPLGDSALDEGEPA